MDTSDFELDFSPGRDIGPSPSEWHPPPQPQQTMARQQSTDSAAPNMRRSMEGNGNAWVCKNKECEARNKRWFGFNTREDLRRHALTFPACIDHLPDEIRGQARDEHRIWQSKQLASSKSADNRNLQNKKVTAMTSNEWREHVNMKLQEMNYVIYKILDILSPSPPLPDKFSRRFRERSRSRRCERSRSQRRERGRSPRCQT